MSALFHEIQAIRSLRAYVADQPSQLPASVLGSIEMIRQSVHGAAAAVVAAAAPAPPSTNAWKKVEHHHSSSSVRPSTANGGYSNRFSRPHTPSHPQTFALADARNHSANTDGSTDAPFEQVVRHRRGGASHYPPRDRNDHRDRNRNDRNDRNREVAQPRGGNPRPTKPHFHHAPANKYVSRFRKTSDTVDDIISNKILLGKLNKFSASNYEEIKEFITHIIASGQTEMIKCFMKLVFEKAASEEMFCPLYARLLSELSTLYPILLDEMGNLYETYMAIFDAVAESKEDETYNELCQRNVEQKYRRGYSQFLAELIKHNVIDAAVFEKTVGKIILQIESQLTNKESVKLVEELADCLLKIVKAMKPVAADAADAEEEDSSEEEDSPRSKGMSPLQQIRALLKNTMLDRIQPFTVRHADHVGLSNKARFTFMDGVEIIQAF